MATIIVRAATPADIPLILELIAGLAEYERLAHEAVADAADLERALFGPRPAAEVVIAECEGRAAGFALCFVSFSMVSAAALSVGVRGIWLELLLSAGFLVWATAQWVCVERRRHRESAFRRDVERYIHALSRSSAPE